jgi:hypothetical protein
VKGVAFHRRSNTDRGGLTSLDIALLEVLRDDLAHADSGWDALVDRVVELVGTGKLDLDRLARVVMTDRSPPARTNIARLHFSVPSVRPMISKNSPDRPDILRLRHHPDDLFALVGDTAEHLGLDPAFVEKASWATELLRSLIRPLPDNSGGPNVILVFKGGTSLKVYRLVDRFSRVGGSASSERSARWGGTEQLLVLWSGLAVLLAIVYMVTYVLLRTSGDGRPWVQRLLHPKRSSDRSS